MVFPTFTPDSDIPDLSDKVIIITGANSGLGYESVIHLARHSPSKLYLCARTLEKYEVAIKGISAAVPNASDFVEYLELDLASLSSTKKAAETFLAHNDRLDILINNAGIMAIPPALTEDGFEIQFGTNHVGHFLLTKLLLPLLLTTSPRSDVRIITLSSDMHRLAPSPTGFLPSHCLTPMSTYSKWTRYAQSKLANLLFTTELARRNPSITSVAIHPGGVETNLMAHTKQEHPWITNLMWPLWMWFHVTASQGAWGQVWAATAPVKGKDKETASVEDKSSVLTKPTTETIEDKGPQVRSDVKEVQNGMYYVPLMKEGTQSKFAKDKKLAEMLWEWTEEQLKERGY